MDISVLQKARAAYSPKLPGVLASHGPAVRAVDGEPTESVADQEAIQERFPHTYGLPVVTFEADPDRTFDPVNVAVILSGGQAPGGHNVIAGIYDCLKRMNPESNLYGFKGGPQGLIDNDYVCFDDDGIDAYRNTGGFDIIGSGRTKLSKETQFETVVTNCRALDISAVVVIGGDDSNTNACILAEYCLRKETGIRVIGCPKTIDGDLKNEWIESSFGFDTATRVYGELIGNIQRDANSAKKYWHFIKVMGRSASHIALECALKTRPNVALISEEVAAQKTTLPQIVDAIVDVVVKRAAAGKNFGVLLVPEGLIEFIPEMKILIAELNDIIGEDEDYFKALSAEDKRQHVNAKLTAASSKALSVLPDAIQLQLLMDRDSHGNVQVSRIETEKLLVDLVGDKLRLLAKKRQYHGTFSTQTHFFGYEGRCAAPSNFDADYCYSLGFVAGCLVEAGKSGYIASVRNLHRPAEERIPGGIPLTMMMNMERRHGIDTPVIQKALVELDGAPFQTFARHRRDWEMHEAYLYPGPIQYFGPSEVCDAVSETIRLERS